MIIDRFANAELYFRLRPAFARAFEFLHRPDLAGLAREKHPIDSERVYIIHSMAPGKDKTDALLEAHGNQIDIQSVIAGCDELGYKPITTCEHLRITRQIIPAAKISQKYLEISVDNTVFSRYFIVWKSSAKPHCLIWTTG